ncbi:MAG: acetyl-CoA carboxylase biotin carboxyl carrier protein [Coriobacteriales bacterium]|nr:acetyl-CoA carboxylase biotin carboxyl carrier protein [Coriobacteriales bacterium]
MDTTLRDAHQSLWATRMETGDMLPIIDKIDSVGYWAIEAWGGATFDTCLRFLDENPWERLRQLKKHCVNTPISMLVRGQNLLGYHLYPNQIVSRFIKAAKRNGIDVFRVFDALNDIRNIRTCAAAVKESGGWFEGAIAYTVSPVHTLDNFVEYALQLKDLGADSICIKDMAGMLTPYRTERMVKAIKEATKLPVHVHCHYVGGMGPSNYLKAAEAGASIVDTASAPLAFGNSQPAVEQMVAALRESGYDTGLDLDLLFEISEYWESVRKRHHYARGVTSLDHLRVHSHQIPGGMMSNLVSQLETQNAADRLPDVMREIPKVRAEVGYPPLVTPLSQIVGTQAVFNVLTGKRWGIVSKEMKNYIGGYYGAAPGMMDQHIVHKVLGDTPPLAENVDPTTLDTTTYEQVRLEIGDLAKSEEDVLMYALFPAEAKSFLSSHKEETNTAFLLENEDAHTKEEDNMDIPQIRELIRTVKETGIGEVTVEEAGSKVTVRADAQPVFAGAAQTAAALPEQTLTEPTAQVVPADAPLTTGGALRPTNWVEVKSPMVGTFYSAPSPDKPAFVSEGEQVMAGQTLCIVEAMKLMNEVPAEQMGVVHDIVAQNGQAVEYGTVLMYIEPTSDQSVNDTVA